MGTIAETIFILTLRQSLSVRKLIVVALIAAIPLIIAAGAAVVGSEWDEESRQLFIQAIVFYTTLPLAALIVAAPIFADEIEDRTFTNLMLSPISRWQIAFPKLSAAGLIVAIPMIISVAASVLIIYSEETYSATAVGALGIAVGTITFVSLFAFVGTLTTRAVIFGIVYVFGFEAFITSTVPGLKYVSISGMTLSITQELSPTLVNAPTSGSNQLPPVEYAAVAIIAIIIVCNAATIWRLKRMDVH